MVECLERYRNCVVRSLLIAVQACSSRKTQTDRSVIFQGNPPSIFEETPIFRLDEGVFDRGSV